MKNYIILFLLFVGWVGVSYAQDGRQEVEISGTVLDENKEPLIGASVTVKDRPGFGTVTDADGRYITLRFWKVLHWCSRLWDTTRRKCSCAETAQQSM